MVAAFDACLLHSHIAHRTDRLAGDDPIAYGHLLTVGMQDFMTIAVAVPDRNPSDCAGAGIFHNAVDRRVHRLIAPIERCIPAAKIVEIGSPMRV